MEVKRPWSSYVLVVVPADRGHEGKRALVRVRVNELQIILAVYHPIILSGNAFASSLRSSETGFPGAAGAFSPTGTSASTLIPHNTLAAKAKSNVFSC